MSASCAFCEENCPVFAFLELSELGSDLEKVDIYCNLSGKSGPIFRASGPWRIPIVARSHACRRICASLWSCLPGVCFRLGCVLWRIRLEKGDGPQAERGGNLRPERRGGTMLSHRDLLWGSRQTVERDVPLARLTIATDVEARVSWEWLWDDALVNGL